MSYTISFDRVGRNHNVPDLTVGTLDPDAVMDEVLRVAGKHCGSRDLEVAVSTEEMRGLIFAGCRNAGSFTITETPAEVPA